MTLMIFKEATVPHHVPIAIPLRLGHQISHRQTTILPLPSQLNLARIMNNLTRETPKIAEALANLSLLYQAILLSQVPVLAIVKQIVIPLPSRVLTSNLYKGVVN